MNMEILTPEVTMKGKSLISINDLSFEEITQILNLSKTLKDNSKNGEIQKPLQGKTLGMIFKKPSTRTRVSFQRAMYDLGGTAFYFSQDELQFGKSESISDTAKVLSRYLDAVLIRTFNHQDIIEFSENSSIPVINGLTDLLHPCQVLTDLFSILERKKHFKGLKLAYVGDGNNVANSLLYGCSKVGIDLYIACPKNYEPDSSIISEAKENAELSGSKIKIIENPLEAVDNADIIYTDVWASMGKESEINERKEIFSKYQVNKELVKFAKKDYLFMHCLPAHRGDEVVNEVCDSENSIIFDQAENRLHVQKAILYLIMSDHISKEGKVGKHTFLNEF